MNLIDYIYDLIKTNLEELKKLKIISLQKLEDLKKKFNIEELIGFFSFFNYKIESIHLRNKELILMLEEKKHQNKINYLNNFFKINDLNLIEFILEERKLLIEGSKLLVLIKDKKHLNLINILKELNRKLEKRIRLYEELKEKVFFMFNLLHNIRFEKIVLHKRILNKIKNKQALLNLFEIVFENLEDYKIINNLFIQVEKENFLFIIRKDSLYIPMIVVEDILHKRNAKDMEILEYYWNNLITPYEKENKELEKIYLIDFNKIENFELFNFYTAFDKEFFILKYFSMKKIREII